MLSLVNHIANFFQCVILLKEVQWTVPKNGCHYMSLVCRAESEDTFSIFLGVIHPYLQLIDCSAVSEAEFAGDPLLFGVGEVDFLYSLEELAERNALCLDEDTTQKNAGPVT